MSISVLAALTAFAFVTTVTPGPNNLMLMASGANFGFRKTLPHMLGIMVGVSVMVLVVGGGLMSLFDAYPLLSKVLQAVSIAYLLWLAWKIANAAPLKASDEKGTPMTFLQAAAFQWVNPKAWAMCLSAITLYAPDRTLLSVVMVACVFAMVSFPAISIWAWLGLVVRQWLTSPKRNRAFNITMAVLLVGSLYPVLA
ncbi:MULTISPECIES: LysE family translocator [Halomonadaceae]|jgi:threonine/homoserine/homoserine lactone efflux protein|uniref:LysE family translocator n=1 Tax=Vreelandella janggokensis TaxID=370767 RepID=A0ABT4ITC2_9GAMM|nr:MULTISPECIES: LysE family translocator [Halomonas]MCZ0926720.1 LysE family translocator [Halomonas janggokensis]MCZ0929258.1 LysE family translocator [Halomonas janggokensis]MDR5885329.1 LysE family translocator [Halomonas janggokensis]